jgi:hypothetical protein
MRFWSGFWWGAGFTALLFDLLIVASIVVAQKGIYPA